MSIDKRPTTDLSKTPIEESPPPLQQPLDDQIRKLIARMRVRQAVVLPAATAYLVMIKALGMGVVVDLRNVRDSDTQLRVYKMSDRDPQPAFPRASIS